MTAAIRELDDASFNGAIASGASLVEFYGTWCPPCKMLEPVIVALGEKYAGKALIAKVNVDDNSESAVENSIADIPTTIVYKNGTEVKRLFGAQSLDTLSLALESALR